MRGCAPVPNWSTTIGAAAEPEPLGASAPVQAPPALKQSAFPAWNVVRVHLVSVCHAVAGVSAVVRVAARGRVDEGMCPPPASRRCSATPWTRPCRQPPPVPAAPAPPRPAAGSPPRARPRRPRGRQVAAAAPPRPPAAAACRHGPRRARPAGPARAAAGVPARRRPCPPRPAPAVPAAAPPVPGFADRSRLTHCRRCPAHGAGRADRASRRGTAPSAGPLSARARPRTAGAQHRETGSETDPWLEREAAHAG